MKNLLLVQGGDAYDLEKELRRFKPNVPSMRMKASDIKAKDLEEALSSSLFSDVLVVIEEAHELAAKAFDLVMAFVRRPVETVFLALHATSRTEFSKLMPVIQIAEVKPWEKQSMIAEWIAAYLKEQNIAVHPQVVAELAKGSSDRFLMQHELDKIIAYVGEKKEIAHQDVVAICAFETEQTVWLLTDSFLQQDTRRAVMILEQLLRQGTSAFLIVRQLRNVCRQALQMCSLAERGVPNIHEYFSQLKGRLFDKNFKLAREAGSEYLSKALLAIDKAELALKDSPFDESTHLLKLFV